MKKCVFGLCMLLVFSCQQEKGMTSEVEKEIIKAIVVNETRAYVEKDYEKWASFWDHSDAVLRLDVADFSFSQTRGWDKNGRHLETFFKENPQPITATFVNANYLVLCDTNLAWVAFDQIWTTAVGVESKAKATATLVKKGGNWKIISYTAIQYESEDATADTLDRE